jgi:uncharacterized membrane protein
MENFISLCKKLHSNAKNSERGLGVSSNINLSSRTKTIALIAIFAALFAVLRRMDAIPMIGVPGARFSLSDILPPIYGIILGPFTGGISVIIGTFLGIAMGKPVIFLFLDFLPALVNTVAIGLLVKRKWWAVVLLYVALLVTFLINPLTSIFIDAGGIAIPFVWLHIVALIVLLSPLARKAPKWVESVEQIKKVEKVEPTKQTNRLKKSVRKFVNAVKRIRYLTIGLFVFAFIGTMMQHLMGNILYEVVLNQFYVVLGQDPIVATLAFPGIWYAAFFVYPLERLVLIVLAVVVGVPLVRVLKQTFFRSERQPTS